MSTLAENIQEQYANGVDVENIQAVGNHIPVHGRGGRLPYCIHQPPSRDGLLTQGVRCGVTEVWLCQNCGAACISYQGRKQ
jgi:hypothetical protein